MRLTIWVSTLELLYGCSQCVGIFYCSANSSCAKDFCYGGLVSILIDGSLLRFYARLVRGFGIRLVVRRAIGLRGVTLFCGAIFCGSFFRGVRLSASSSMVSPGYIATRYGPGGVSWDVTRLRVEGGIGEAGG